MAAAALPDDEREWMDEIITLMGDDNLRDAAERIYRVHDLSSPIHVYDDLMQTLWNWLESDSLTEEQRSDLTAMCTYVCSVTQGNEKVPDLAYFKRSMEYYDSWPEIYVKFFDKYAQMDAEDLFFGEG